MILDRLYGLPIWGLRKLGIETLITLILLTVVMGSIAVGLEEITYIQPGKSLLLITIFSMLSGWAFVRTSLSTFKTSFSLAALGGLWILMYSANMSAKVFASIVEAFRLVLDLIRWLPGTPYPNTSVLTLLLTDITIITTDMLHHLWLWISAFLTGRPIFDPIGATLFWGSLVWGVSAWAGWAVRRHSDPLYAVLPGSAVLAFGMAYSRVDATYLIPVLSGSLLLLAWVRFNREKQDWDRQAVDYAEDINFDIVVWTSAIVLGIIVFSIVLSLISPQRIFGFVRDLGRPRAAEVSELGESLGLQKNQPDVEIGLAQGELPRAHLLGSGPDLSRQVVMTIKAEPLISAPAQTITATIEPSYRWRALTYDLYTGSGWATSPTYTDDYPPDVSHTPISYSTQIPFDQSVSVLADIGKYVYVAGELVSVNQDHQVSWRRVITEIEGIPESELDQPNDMFGAAFEQDTSGYSANSLVMVVGTSELSATHENYPRWISERYLQLPDTVPERVIDLAKQLTTAADNPYDKAQILENYLRKIPYNLDISAPPAYKDVADYFIYDLGEGYCDYYATAMAVMGRAVGLPTRFVMGYTTGLYDHSQDRFVITAKDAHSWVEVYFNEIGWVEFEPTGGISAIIRPESVVFDQMIEDRISSTDPLPPVENWPSWLPWLPLILGGTVLLASLYLIWRLSDTWRLRRMPSDLTATELYRRLFIQAKQLKIAQTPNQTPHEFNQNLNDHISSISTYRRWQLHWRSQISAIRAETQQLVDLYAQTVYSPETPDSYSTYKAICIWTNLRQRLMLTRILRRLHPIDIDQNNPANKQTSQ